MAGQKHSYHGLAEGERLVWTGTPCEYKDYGRIDRVLLPISYLMLTLSAFFAALVMFSIQRLGFQLWHVASLLLLVPVLALSAYSVFFRFLLKRRNKTDFAYGVTSMGRVLICDHAEERTYAFSPEQLTHAAVTETDKHGAGTIYLSPKRPGHMLDNTGLEFLGQRNGMHIALYDIPDCEKVFKMIRPKKKK